MTIINPQRRTDIFVEGSQDEAMLYHPESDELHVLNPTARLIWDLCDGTHSMDDMVNQVRVAFRVPAHVNLQHDVEQTLNEFAQKGLLVQAEPSL